MKLDHIPLVTHIFFLQVLHCAPRTCLGFLVAWQLVWELPHSLHTTDRWPRSSTILATQTPQASSGEGSLVALDLGRGQKGR